MIVEVKLIGLSTPSLFYRANFDVCPMDIVEVPLRNKVQLAIVVRVTDEYDASFEIKDAERSEFSFTDTQKVLLDFVSQYYMCDMGVSARIFRYLNKCDGDKKEIEMHGGGGEASNLSTLSETQQKALDTINHNIRGKKFINLIFGDTGSGKTEIYMHMIQQSIKEGKQSLFLMPEISLSPQVEHRLKTVFGNRIGIWHSKKSKRQREEVLRQLVSGEIKIIAGARSALFLPFEHLDVVIVDEEHDDSYKSVQNPKYNARDVAMFLSKKGVKVILGSATPSPSSYHIARSSNSLIRVRHSFHNADREIICDSTNECPSNTMVKHIMETLQRNKQIIIFMPTRANFKALVCSECGNAIKCQNCSVSLSLHRKRNALICHYCNHMQDAVHVCDTCGGDLKGLRFGTQELKEQLDKLINHGNDLKNSGEAVPGTSRIVNIEIFDRDHMTTQKKISKTLDDFKNNKIDILIGTQMITKGHDYPNVGMSVIMGVDFFLNMQTYRANELAYSLIYQVAGRTGRKERGIFLIQSKRQDIASDIQRDYELILQEELSERQNLYPPFYKMALLKISHKDMTKALEITKRIHSQLRKISGFDFEVVGYGECEVVRIDNVFYYQILVRSKKKLELQRVMLRLTSMLDHKTREHMDIDIDSLSA